ncbi:hypothetical protein NX059_003318 [Plenodomus lindquistii]|nr:hypothetical protein NX059_003318 [Plenodomus lindquistii]
MEPSVILPAVALSTATAPVNTPIEPELSSFGLKTLNKLLQRSAAEISTLLGLLQDVQDMKTQEKYDMKGSAYRDAGSLLTMPKATAECFLQSVCEKRETPKINVKMNEGQLKWANGIFNRMRAQPDEYTAVAKDAWKTMLGWKVSKEKNPRLKDLGTVLQHKDASIAEIVRRLEIARRQKEIGQDEKVVMETDQAPAEPTVTPSPSRIASKKNTKAAFPRPRQAHPRGLGQMSINDDPKAQDSNGKKGAITATPANTDNNKNNNEKKRKWEDGDIEAPKSANRQQQPKKRTGYRALVGDWRCARCDFWNDPESGKCESKRKCKGMKDSDLAEVALDDGWHRKPYNPNDDPDVMGNDWQCECGLWKKSYWIECGSCGRCKGSSNRVMKVGPNKPARPTMYVNKRNPAFSG